MQQVPSDTTPPAGVDPVEALRGVQGLAAFHSPDLGAALSAAETCARGLVPPGFWSSDIYVALPEGDRWTAEELTNQLVYQQAYQPLGDVRVVILAFTHLMDRRLHDHLLKIVEEPPAPVLFIAVVPEMGTLPVTLQSRVYRSFEVPARAAAELTGLIRAAAGSEPSPAVVQLAQRAPLTAAALEGPRSSGVLDSLEEFLAALLRTGFTAAAEANSHLEAAARAISDGPKAAPGTRAARREVLNTGLHMLRRAQVRAASVGTAEDAAPRLERAERIARAERLAAVHLPADQVLAYAQTLGGAYVEE